jgi:NTE family protein
MPVRILSQPTFKFALIFILLMSVHTDVTPLLAQAVPQKTKIGLALSGGGAKGLIHVGVLKVLEEAGLKIDFIAGTSMGSQIGALYAIGYDASSIEEIVTSQDWEALLSDRISRKDISIEEKQEDSRYVSTFPIRNGKISLPGGLISGQRASLLLSRLTLPIHHVNDFKSFPIPFLCIATDLETGEAVVLDSGFLPDALRASMSIPSVFTPVEMDGQLLVDGGLVRNLPASDVREMGADIVIGVDVGAPLYQKEKLNSLVNVMEQTVNFRGAASTKRQQELCDILISPNLHEFGIMSFDAVDTLISLGEQAARQMLSQLQALADINDNKQLNQRLGSRLKPPEKIYVTELAFEGLSRVSENLLLAKLRIKIPSLVTFAQIGKAIERAYGTKFFERVTYKIEPGQTGTRLVIRVIEQRDDVFRIGANYDNDLKSSILLNTTFRNKLVDGSKLSLSARLSQNPAFEGYYQIATNWQPGIGLRFGLNYRNMDVLVYDAAGRVEARLDYNQYLTSITLQSIFRHSLALSAGVEHSHTSMQTQIAPPDSPGYAGGNYDLLNVFVSLRLDTFDRTLYPRRGVKLLATSKLVRDLGNSIFMKLRFAGESVPTSFFSHLLSFECAVPLGSKLSLLGSLFAGVSSSDLIPDDYMFYLGGSYAHMDTFFPFLGLNFLEKGGSQALASMVGLQWEVKNNLYATLRFNAGKTTNILDDLLNSQDIITGSGLSLGTLTPIGPLEITFAHSNEKDHSISNINIGYKF